VLTRILLFIGLAVASASAAAAQPAADPNLPEECRAKTEKDTLPALEQRMALLERELAQSAKPDKAAATLSKTQEELLDLLFRIDCLKARERTAAAAAQPTPGAMRGRGELAKPGLSRDGAGLQSAQPPPAPAPAPEAAAPPPTFRSVRKLAKPDTGADNAGSGKAIEVTTYYATNRGLTGKSEPATGVFDATRGKELTYGRAIVTIPPTHVSGIMEQPGGFWIFSASLDPNRHFTLKKVENLGLDKMRAEMARRLQASGSKALLVFVHGYNMKFEDAAMRTAQLAHDLKFPGMPFFFSWPSAGQYLRYAQDEQSAEWSQRYFDRVLDELAQLPATEIYLIAHSMGTRLVSRVLQSRVERGKPTANVSQLLLAAPDIDADVFSQEIAPRLQEMQSTRTTVYASSNDLALKASKIVHGYPRVGETDTGVFVYPGVETIDASSATRTGSVALGHSYLTDSIAVLRDIGVLLRQKLRARQRGLPEAGTSPKVWYKLPPA
jgi:esterase/lipase superfamily enzyme